MPISRYGVNDMPRPRKWRRVCDLPDINLFGPLNGKVAVGDFIIMTVEEYETIRLIDFEGMMQEECAARMNVARTTVQKIYNDARKKVAEALVNGRALKIEGGDYRLCEEHETEITRPCGCCNRRRFRNH